MHLCRTEASKVYTLLSRSSPAFITNMRSTSAIWQPSSSSYAPSIINTAMTTSPRASLLSQLARRSHSTLKSRRPAPTAKFGRPPPPEQSQAPTQHTPAWSAAQENVKDPARGLEASMRVARGGKLDARYRGASRSVLAVIVAVPFAIVLGYELYQRRFADKQQKSVAR